MRYFNKLWVLLLVFSMVLSTVAYGAVPADVAGTAYRKAAERLGALGIMVGDAGGFRPEEPVKRSEIAKIIVAALGLEQTAAASAGSTVFQDVGAADWASGYVNVAYSSGIITGTGEGRFAPDENVTYEQAVKMIVCALGYEPAAVSKGGYPEGYMVVAVETGITDGVKAFQGESAKRGVVAQLIDNALEIPMMVQSGYGNKARYVQSGTSGTEKQTLLESRLKLEVFDAHILAINEREKTIELEKEDKTVSRSVYNEVYYERKEEYKYPEYLSVSGLQDAYVTVWANKDSDTIYMIEKYESDDVLYDFISEVNGDNELQNQYTRSQIEDITLWNRDEVLDIENQDVEIYVNTELFDKNTPAQYLINGFVKIVKKNGTIKRVDIFGSYNPSFAQMMLNVGGMITATEGDKIQYTHGDPNGVTIKQRKIATQGWVFTEPEDTKGRVIIIDGKLSSFSDLKPDMYFDYWKGIHEYVIVASSKKAEGTINGYSDESIILNDKDKAYPMGLNVYYSVNNGKEYADEDKRAFLIEDNATLYLDARGEVRYVKSAAGEEEFYGIVLKMDKEIGKDSLKIFREMNGTGTEADYEVSKNFLLDGKTDSYDDLKLTAEKTDGSGIFKFFLDDDGKIYKAEGYQQSQWETFGTASDNQFYTSSKAMRIGGTYLNVDDAPIFNLTDINGKFEPTLVNWDSIKGKYADEVTMKVLRDGSDLHVALFEIGSGRAYSSYYVVSNTGRSYGFITDKTKVGPEKYEITVDKGGTTEKYTVEEGFLRFYRDKNIIASKNCFIIYSTGAVGHDGSISIRGIVDLNNPANWPANTSASNTFTPTSDSGGSITFKADQPVYERQKGSIRFAESSERYNLDSKAYVFEITRDKQNNPVKFEKRSIIYVGVADRVAYLRHDSSVRVILFDKKD